MMPILGIIGRHRLFILVIIGLLVMSVLVFTQPPSTQAAETVIIVSQTVYCDRIDVTYEVIAAFPTDYAIITSHSGNTQLGSVNGTGTPSGTYSATVPVSPAQPAGTMLRVEIEINDGNGYIVNAVGSPVACYNGDGGGGESPTWNGYTDGRLNPDPAEYYTLYCHEGTDTVYVVRTSPETEIIKEIPLRDIIELVVGSSMYLGDFMSLFRNTEDTITIYGSNGNLAPAAGSKSFSLAECIDRNGGEPDTDVTPPSDEDDDNDDQDEETEEERQQRRRREAEEELEYCYDSYEFFGGDSDLLAGCLNGVLIDYDDVLTGQEISTLVINIFCLNLIIGAGVLPIGIVIFKRKRRSHKSQ